MQVAIIADCFSKVGVAVAAPEVVVFEVLSIFSKGFDNLAHFAA